MTLQWLAHGLRKAIPKQRFRLLPAGAEPTAANLLTSRGLRAFGDGLVSILLPAYLATLGFDAFEIGTLSTATLAGSAALTLAVGIVAHRFSRRALLTAAAVLMIATGIVFAVVHDFWPLLLIAFVGTLNPSSGDVSVFPPLEHAQLAQSVPDRDRTALFARYSLIGSLAGAVGALAAGAPDFLRDAIGLEMKQALQAAFLFYASLGLAAVLLYRRLPSDAPDAGKVSAQPLRRSRSIVLSLAALFSLDAFAGGFVVQSLLALWLFQRFGLSLAATGAIFFWTGVLSAASYLAQSARSRLDTCRRSSRIPAFVLRWRLSWLWPGNDDRGRHGHLSKTIEGRHAPVSRCIR
ncbi:MFS transporter [Mesorhizobium sp. M1136]|uniref:MFS transporter n=1 Tax=unclassified Mesorhizobium TaxID=325217 RepID=UPI0033385775